MRTPRRRLGPAPISTVILIVVLTMLAAPSLVADAQPAGNVPRVAYLNASSAASATWAVKAFRLGLRELGYIEGQNILVEFRWADGRFERLPALAAELARSNVDVIVAQNTSAALAVKNATSTIPISGCAPDSPRCYILESARTDGRARDEEAPASGIRGAGVRGGWRPHGLWRKLR